MSSNSATRSAVRLDARAVGLVAGSSAAIASTFIAGTPFEDPEPNSPNLGPGWGPQLAPPRQTGRSGRAIVLGGFSPGGVGRDPNVQVPVFSGLREFSYGGGIDNHVHPTPGLRAYRHLDERELGREVVRRGIVPSSDVIQLDRLDAAWRPTVLRAVLAVHDRFPQGALRFDAGIGVYTKSDVTAARYIHGRRRMEINTYVYSPEKAARVPAGSTECAQLNHLAGVVVHECWHCIQDPYTPEFRNFIAERWERVTNDPRARFPLAYEQWREELFSAVSPYALTQRIELEAELARRYFQGAHLLLASEMMSAVDTLIHQRVPARVPEVRASDVRTPMRDFLARVLRRPVTPRVQTAASPVPTFFGDQIAGASGAALLDPNALFREATRVGADAEDGRATLAYVQTEAGEIMRIDGARIVHVTQSFDAGRLIRHTISEQLRAGFVCEVGEPLHIEGGLLPKHVLPEEFAGSPVARIVSVPRGVHGWAQYGIAPNMVPDAGTLKTDSLVRNAETMLARVAGLGRVRSAAAAGLEQACWERGYLPAHVRCTQRTKRPFGRELFEDAPHWTAIVVRDTSGKEFWIERDAAEHRYMHADLANHHRTVIHVPAECVSEAQDIAIWPTHAQVDVGDPTGLPQWIQNVAAVDIIELLPVALDSITPTHQRGSVARTNHSTRALVGR